MRLKLFLISIALVLGIHCLDAKNRALLVGIGNYDTAATGWKVIHGNNDVTLLKDKLQEQGFSVISLIDSKATKANIVRELKALTDSTKPGDVVYIHFSGHGQLIKDLNNDEIDDYDQSFVCVDASISPNFKGNSYYGQNHLIDDELFTYINNIRNKLGKSGQIYIIFDMCYSEDSIRDGIYEDPDPESEVEWVSTVRGTDEEFILDRKSKGYLSNKLDKPGNFSKNGCKITAISACERNNKNYECKEKHSGRKYGTLSFCLSKMLDKNIPLTQWGNYFKNGTYKSLRVFRESQIPVVETH